MLLLLLLRGSLSAELSAPSALFLSEDSHATVLKTLDAGEKVEVLRRDDARGFVLVRADGEEGWLPQRVLNQSSKAETIPEEHEVAKKTLWWPQKTRPT